MFTLFLGTAPGQFCVVCAMFPEAMSVRGCEAAVHLICPGPGIMYPSIPVTLGQESLPRQWSEEETN